jgi:hypothetical protein
MAYMDITEIIKLATSYIEQANAGLDKEHPKFDFKRSWYDLTSPLDINEFVKDTTSIANTVGLDGFILIGYDDVKKEFNPSIFRDSKLSDSSQIMNIINKKVDRLFEINTYDIEVLGHKVSIIHIPPSLDKPHVIRLHQTFHQDGNIKNSDENRIFVRKNSSTYKASKYDIELMFYDRKNLIPDYEIRCYFDPKLSHFNFIDNKLEFSVNVTMENIGRRAIAIRFIYLTLDFASMGEIIDFTSHSRYVANNIIIKSEDVWNDRLDFVSNERFSFADNQERNRKHFLYNGEVKLSFNNLALKMHLANGTIINSVLQATVSHNY